VAAVPECEPLAIQGDTFDCLQSVDASILLNAFNIAVANSSQQFTWIPVLDGRLLPDLSSRLQQVNYFARLPVIAGTDLDEGENDSGCN
jgi:acetylcholinesterase